MGESVPWGYGLLEFDLVQMDTGKRRMITVAVWVNAGRQDPARHRDGEPERQDTADNTSEDKAIVCKH